MGSRRVEAIILCEDRQQDVFVRRYLRMVGYRHARPIFFDPASRRLVDRADRHHPRPVPPSGAGGGADDHVIGAYADQVRKCRAARAPSCLVVVVDADNLTVGDRIGALSRRLQEARIPERGASEELAVLVPRRSIETWIRCLDGKGADESTAYPHHKPETDCYPAADMLAEWRRANNPPPPDCMVPDGWVPSLRRACIEELLRLPVRS